MSVCRYTTRVNFIHGSATPNFHTEMALARDVCRVLSLYHACHWGELRSTQIKRKWEGGGEEGSGKWQDKMEWKRKIVDGLTVWFDVIKLIFGFTGKLRWRKRKLSWLQGRYWMLLMLMGLWWWRLCYDFVANEVIEDYDECFNYRKKCDSSTK